MKRDMDLVRELLLAVEAAPADAILANRDLQFSGHSDVDVAEHVMLLADGGLLDVIDAAAMRSPGTPRQFYIRGITWTGYEYLDSVRNPEIWRKTKSTIVEKGAELTMDLVMAVAKALIKQQVGLFP
jgi:uncharacterized protein DUF2513